ncbi:hypothetical protein [Marinobacterium aestuariivivens]|uniref:Uncharacterized protein n=1 Tax=Marinobacterium aestuariivivens TaxID=1698799 RepID=A0ABW1ZZN0_9GAMM
MMKKLLLLASLLVLPPAQAETLPELGSGGRKSPSGTTTKRPSTNTGSMAC